MSAILLLAKCSVAGNFCVLVCGHVSSGSNKCHRIGIGTIRWVNLEEFSSHLVKGEVRACLTDIVLPMPQ